MLEVKLLIKIFAEIKKLVIIFLKKMQDLKYYVLNVLFNLLFWGIFLSMELLKEGYSFLR